MKPHLLSVLQAIQSYSGCPFPHLCLLGYCLCFVLMLSEFHVSQSIFMSDDMCLIYFLSLWTFSFPKTIYWRYYLLQSMSLASLSNIKWLYLGYLYLGLFFCFIGLQSIFMPPFYYFPVYITMALEIWTGNPISLAIQGLLWFQMKFWVFLLLLFYFFEEWDENFEWKCTERVNSKSKQHWDYILPKSQWIRSTKLVISAGMDGEKEERLLAVGGIVNWYNHSEN